MLQKLTQKINKIELQYPSTKKYFYNTAWLFAEKGLRLITALLIGAMVARYLGPGQFGLLNYVISLVTLFGAFFSLGLDQIVIRELIKNRENELRFLGTVFTLRIMGAILIIIFLAIIIKISNTNSQTSILILIVASSMLFEAFGVIDFYFQSQVISKYAVWSQMIVLGSLSVLRIILVYNQASLEWFAFAYLLDYLVYAVCLIIFYTRRSNLINWSFDSISVKELLRQSWPLMLSSLAVGLYMKIDQVMIKWMLGNEASGNYGVAVRLSEIWNFIPVAICSSLMPSIIGMKIIDVVLYRKRLQMLYDLMIGLSVLIAIPMTFFSGFIIHLLYGRIYADAGAILSIYIWSGIFVFLGVATSKYLVNENLQIFQMKGLLIAALLNIMLNFVLINLVGIVGAAVSTLISYSFATYFILLFNSKTRDLFTQCSKSLNLIRLTRRLIFFIKK